MSWDTSDRRSRLPSDWPKLREQTRQRAGGRCEGLSLRGEPRWHADECDRIGSECDHDKRGDDHSLSNLRWVSTPCHKRKTQGEKPTRRRQPETHPGRLT